MQRLGDIGPWRASLPTPQLGAPDAVVHGLARPGPGRVLTLLRRTVWRLLMVSGLTLIGVVVGFLTGQGSASAATGPPLDPPITTAPLGSGNSAPTLAPLLAPALGDIPAPVGRTVRTVTAAPVRVTAVPARVMAAVAPVRVTAAVEPVLRTASGLVGGADVTVGKVVGSVVAAPATVTAGVGTVLPALSPVLHPVSAALVPGAVSAAARSLVPAAIVPGVIGRAASSVPSQRGTPAAVSGGAAPGVVSVPGAGPAPVVTTAPSVAAVSAAAVSGAVDGPGGLRPVGGPGAASPGLTAFFGSPSGGFGGSGPGVPVSSPAGSMPVAPPAPAPGAGLGGLGGVGSGLAVALLLAGVLLAMRSRQVRDDYRGRLTQIFFVPLVRPG